jgi:hypothetical protein
MEARGLLAGKRRYGQNAPVGGTGRRHFCRASSAASISSQTSSRFPPSAIILK